MVWLWGTGMWLSTRCYVPCNVSSFAASHTGFPVVVSPMGSPTAEMTPVTFGSGCYPAISTHNCDHMATPGTMTPHSPSTTTTNSSTDATHLSPDLWTITDGKKEGRRRTPYCPWSWIGWNCTHCCRFRVIGVGGRRRRIVRSHGVRLLLLLRVLRLPLAFGRYCTFTLIRTRWSLTFGCWSFTGLVLTCRVGTLRLVLLTVFVPFRLLVLRLVRLMLLLVLLMVVPLVRSVAGWIRLRRILLTLLTLPLRRLTLLRLRLLPNWVRLTLIRFRVPFIGLIRFVLLVVRLLVRSSRNMLRLFGFVGC